MFSITGITGQVGGQVAAELLRAGQPVRAVLRDPTKASAWAARGCEVALAAMDDAGALSLAFEGAEAVFVLLPPLFDPAPGFPETRANVAAISAALRKAAPKRVVCLSTIGAQAAQENLLTQLQIMERALEDMPMPTAFLRAAWFMENLAWDIEPARATHTLSTFLQPLDKSFPMVATADVARAVVRLLRSSEGGRRVVELEGPERVSPRDVAATLAQTLGHAVLPRAVPRSEWEASFLAQGMKHPAPRIRMLEGFNEGWIEFERGDATAWRGETTLAAFLDRVVKK